ncbi:MAG: hypothetical protein JW881_11710 [Spirochaetales bacterium]|nr:hypothetical protein [Spirochaetales bacterium]
MKESNDLHQQAMILAEKAFFLKFENKIKEAIEFFKQAYELEKKAALLLNVTDLNEPTRSVLFRSAASLAINARKYREAEIMVSYGLIGNPPYDVAEELRNLLEQLNMERHLDIKGIILRDDEIQLSLAGPEIGFGMVKSDEFLKRIDIIEKLAYRIAERRERLPFREQGRVPKHIKNNVEPYFSIPRAASFAVTIRFGQEAKNYLLFDDEITAKSMIEELTDNIELVNNSQEEQLKNIIKQEDYFNNFIALTKKLSPDSKNINLVGITSRKGNKEKRVAFIRPGKDIKIPKHKEMDESIAQKIEIIGIIKYASAFVNRVELTDEDGNKYKVIIPKGMMSDIVKPYWEEKVKIFGNIIADKIYFDDIEKV